MRNNKYLSKLNFKVINITSIEEDNKINPKEKFSKLLQRGGFEWTSERFCSYPQEITIQFDSPVYLYQINFLCNEKKTPKHIIFHSFCPENYDKDKNYKYSEIVFDIIGYVDLKDTKDCNFQIREFKKVFINIKTLFLKILLDINYINNYNKFQQVSIKNIECLGSTINHSNIIIDIDRKDKENQNKLNINVEKVIREIIGDKYDKVLEKYMNLDKNEDNDDYLQIKNKIEEMNSLGKKVYQIKLLEKNASKNDDFDKAIELKNKGAKYKDKVRNIFGEISKKLEIGDEERVPQDENLENGDINELINKNEGESYALKKIKENENENKPYQKKLNISLTELDLLKDGNEHDNMILPAINKKKLYKNKSEMELKAEEEKNYKQKLLPLEKLTEENLNDFKLLINYLKENGLRHLLSNQIGYKMKGFAKLLLELNNIFLDDNLIDILYELINLEGLFLQDKNISTIINSFDIIRKTFNHLNETEPEIKGNKKLMKYIKERIINKIQSFLGHGETKVRTEASQLYTYILKLNLFGFKSLIDILLANDIHENIYNPISNNSQNIKVYSKLKIIKNLLEDYENIINENITSEENFPKDIILDYILMNIKNNKLEIKNITRELLDIAAKLFGPDTIRHKIYYYIDDDKELLKLLSQVESLKPLLDNMNVGLTKSNSQANIMKSKPKKMKLKKNASQSDIKSSSKYSKYNNKFEEKKNNNKTNSNNKGSTINKSNIKNNKSQYNQNRGNICELCKKNLGYVLLKEHKTKCKMCGKCEGCNEYVTIEKLNYHKLNACKFKKKFKECKKCKEAISLDLYDLHTKKNVCNFAKDDMNRCPLCHHDIEKSDDGFYQHLVIDGCAYQKNN